MCTVDFSCPFPSVLLLVLNLWQLRYFMMRKEWTWRYFFQTFGEEMFDIRRDCGFLLFATMVGCACWAWRNVAGWWKISTHSMGGRIRGESIESVRGRVNHFMIGEVHNWNGIRIFALSIASLVSVMTFGFVHNLPTHAVGSSSPFLNKGQWNNLC